MSGIIPDIAATFGLEAQMALLVARRRFMAALGGAVVGCWSAPARAQQPAIPEQAISAAEARAIIEGAVAYARGKNLRLGVVVVDTSGELIAGERMDGTPGRNIMMATAKAFTSVMYRTTTQQMSELYKTSPDRYFGIMNLYGNKVYLVGGGVPLTVDGRLAGAVGVAGMPGGQDEAAARAGIAAWEQLRATLRK
jgi:uncharacterized protein GlcG (DUF336 family)